MPGCEPRHYKSITDVAVDGTGHTLPNWHPTVDLQSMHRVISTRAPHVRALDRLAVALGAAAVLTACGNQVPDPAEHAVSESVEDFEEYEGDWDYAEPDTPACHSYLKRESALFDALEDEDATSFDARTKKRLRTAHSAA
jgi:hypothetical protein